MTKIETERLILREMTPGDFDRLYAVLADSDIMQHYPHTFDETRVRNWINKNLECYRVFGFSLWAVCLKENGGMIGDCGLTMQNINGTILLEIGYHIAKAYQRRGYAKEAAQAVRDWTFRNTPFMTVYSYIVAGLNCYWSPETIAGRWHLEYPERKPLCISTIYRYVKKRLFPKITPKTHLRRRGKRILPRNSNYNSIQPERIIPQWPEEIRQRARIGDWEGDTVYGGVGKGLLVTQVDRKSRFLRAGLLAKRDASLTKAVICQLLKDVPVKSISLDNGSEFSEFKALESELHTLVYFAEPHKPWQRGTNENTNGLLRFFFPKGCDFHAVSQKFVDSVVDLINSRPRKCLGWRSPAEVFHNLGVALA